MSQRELVRLERVGNRHVIRFTQDNLTKNSTARDATGQISDLLSTQFGSPATANDLDAANAGRVLEIDFTEISKISTTVLNGLIQVHRDACDLEVSLELVNLTETVRDIFSLTRLDRMFTLPKTGMV